VSETYLQYKEITVNVTRQSEVSVSKHVINNPADMAAQMSFIGVGESLHNHRHIASRLMIDKQ